MFLQSALPAPYSNPSTAAVSSALFWAYQRSCPFRYLQCMLVSRLCAVGRLWHFGPNCQCHHLHLQQNALVTVIEYTYSQVGCYFNCVNVIVVLLCGWHCNFLYGLETILRNLWFLQLSKALQYKDFVAKSNTSVKQCLMWGATP